ncbi:Aminopeptidase N [Eumeta japonica]|uniref:Aminopeptidase N n=1 Tax=Eumeta variegata TaxID=151549 RepID=A0A4C1XLW1_EUMVA|nr:Aminopeptidase N [Eumeta japonica]
MLRRAIWASLAAALCLSVQSLPPDKMRRYHIIKARSIDIYNVYGVAMETRLFSSVEPTGYKLELEPYLEDGVFNGRVSINMTWVQDYNRVEIYVAHDIDISATELWIRGPDSREMTKAVIESENLDEKKSIYTIRLNEEVRKNSTGRLDISFSGNLETATTEGFFKTTYTDANEQESTEPSVREFDSHLAGFLKFMCIVAATQLRPNNARRMFPCFDEPTFKAPFELSVVCPRNMVALSNTPVARTENITGEPNAIWVHFEKTPPMSTFTLGLVIADLKQLGETIEYKDEYGNDIELRLWGRQEYLTALKGVDEKIHKVFSEIARYWRVPLPLRKLDVVALPNYQGVKPADNWGLIVFNYTLEGGLRNSLRKPSNPNEFGLISFVLISTLALDDARGPDDEDFRESDLSNRGYLQLTQEVLYQWLGAFTTPDWWWYAHLNKGLVGFLAAKTAFQIDNGVEMEGKWPMTVLYSLYYEFGKPYPHSRITGMKQEMECTKIELLFRMFNYTLGADTFDKGVRTFLDTRKFITFLVRDAKGILMLILCFNNSLHVINMEYFLKSEK